MRWHTARQAWHDATYNGRPSVMAVAVENANLGAAIQGSNRSHDPSVHQAEAGKVQHAISQLPQHLQEVGNWLYSPYTAEQRAARLNNVGAIVAREADLINLVPPGNWMPLIWATLYEYARVVLGVRTERTTGRGIKRWISDELHEEYGDWTGRDRRVYEALWDAINRLDRQALAPVAELVYDQIERKSA